MFIKVDYLTQNTNDEAIESERNSTRQWLKKESKRKRKVEIPFNSQLHSPYQKWLKAVAGKHMESIAAAKSRLFISVKINHLPVATLCKMYGCTLTELRDFCRQEIATDFDEIYPKAQADYNDFLEKSNQNTNRNE